MPMSNTFDLLAEPTRRRLLDALREGECSVGTLVARLNMSQPAVSKQLRVLREAGLAEVRQDGQRRMYRLNAERLQEVDQWLQPFREYWQPRLEMMEQVLAKMED